MFAPIIMLAPMVIPVRAVHTAKKVPIASPYWISLQSEPDPYHRETPTSASIDRSLALPPALPPRPLPFGHSFAPVSPASLPSQRLPIGSPPPMTTCLHAFGHDSHDRPCALAPAWLYTPGKNSAGLSWDASGSAYRASSTRRRRRSPRSLKSTT